MDNTKIAELKTNIETKEKRIKEIEEILDNSECCKGRAFATCIYSGFAITEEQYSTYWDDIIPDMVLSNGWPRIEYIKEFCEKNQIKNNEELEAKNLEDEVIDGVDAQYIAIEESLKTNTATIYDDQNETWTKAEFDEQNKNLNDSLAYYEELESELSTLESEVSDLESEIEELEEVTE